MRHVGPDTLPASLRRREVLAVAGILLPLATTGPFLLGGCGRSPVVRSDLSPGFLDRITDIVLPATGSAPGALKVGAAAFLGRALDHGLYDAQPGAAVAIETDLDARVPAGGFMKASADAQRQAIVALDAQAYPAPDVAPAAPLPIDRHWIATKTAIVTGFYMSEYGASQELQYELVPGRFDPDIPFKPGDRYLSNNWIANFG